MAAIDRHRLLTILVVCGPLVLARPATLRAGTPSSRSRDTAGGNVAIRAGGSGQPSVDPRDPLEPLYDRIAVDLRRGRPLVITVHVALCDNRVIRCGGRRLGDGDRPDRNLYWGGAAGFRAYFDHQRGTYRRIHLDRGDGETVLERAVYRHRVGRPGATWRRRGVTAGFDVLIVGLAYRGMRIARAMDALVHQAAAPRRRAPTLAVAGYGRVPIGGSAHVVGYAGHNHLMDVFDYRFPKLRRREHAGYFALACLSARYLAPQLRSSKLHALLLTRTFMYPGAFTIDGLARGLWSGAPQAEVFRQGAAFYARYQRRPQRTILRAFTHGSDPRLRAMRRIPRR